MSYIKFKLKEFKEIIEKAECDEVQVWLDDGSPIKNIEPILGLLKVWNCACGSFELQGEIL